MRPKSSRTDELTLIRMDMNFDIWLNFNQRITEIPGPEQVAFFFV